MNNLCKICNGNEKEGLFLGMCKKCHHDYYLGIEEDKEKVMIELIERRTNNGYYNRHNEK